MLTRRALIQQGMQAGAALAVAGWASQGCSKESVPTLTTDQMTLNSAWRPWQAKAPLPPPPATLPRATIALSGANSLEAHAHRHGLLAGAAVVVRELQSDPALQQLVAEQYGILVCENELKWIALRPTEQRFDFTQSDALFDFAKAHHLQVRGHNLVWHNSVPEWLVNSSSQLDVRQLLIDHIHTVAGRYRGRVHSWDVVNEAILPSDKQVLDLRKSFWFDRIGPEFIEIAFRAAREADPLARLTYNDYGIEYDNAEHSERRAAILALLRHLQERKVPLDAVGIQGHIWAASPDAIGKGLAGFIESVRRMGLEVYITEVDVNEDDLEYDDVARRDRTIAKAYRDFLAVALANPAVKAMLTWGVSDRRSWLNEIPSHLSKRPNRPQRALPFDSDYAPKPAFFAIRESFDARSA